MKNVIENIQSDLKIQKEKVPYFRRQIRHKGYNPWGCTKARARKRLPEVLALIKEMKLAIKILSKYSESNPKP